MQLHKRVRRLSAVMEPARLEAALGNPVFILSAPRSGSTLLFSLLASHPDVWTIGGESHGLYGEFPHLRAADEDLSSGALSARHADGETVVQLRQMYVASLRNGDGQHLYDRLVLDPATTRGGVFLEKTPRNAFNVPFLRAVFPNARFIFLHREPRANISSIIEGWQRGAQTGQFVTWRDLPGRPGPWCFLLPPGWQAFHQASVAQIAAFQWQAANETIMEDLSGLPRSQWIALDYDALTQGPAQTLEALCSFCCVTMSPAQHLLTAGKLPLSASTITAPDRGKWQRHAAELAALSDVFSPTYDRLRAF